MRKCKKCKVEKHEDEFYFYKSKNYRDGKCKKCRNEYNNNWKRITYTDNEKYEREKLLKEGKNKCFCCEETKPLSAFKKTNHVKTGYHNTCRSCKSVREKNTKLKKAYGINLDDFNSMMEKQNFTCKICSTKLNGNKDTAVDHCHSTGKVRGLLCNSCNRALGLFKDNTHILYSAIKYLKK